MNTTLQDGPWDMYVEDLLSLHHDRQQRLPVEQHLDVEPPAPQRPKVDEFYARYARELDAGQAQGHRARSCVEYMADNMYWNNISGSPFYMVAQPWMKGYTYNAEFEVHYDTVWLDK